MSCDYYDDERFCPACRTYVRYLRAVSTSFCVRCGGEVRLYSEDDLAVIRTKPAAAAFELRPERADEEYA